MSTTDRIVDNKFAKRLVIINGLVPAAILVIDAVRDNLGVNSVNFAIKTTGLVGLVLLIVSLLITPLRKLTGWQTLIAVRRNLGVLGFSYLACHFLIFFWFDQDHSVGGTLREIIDRVYLWFGFGALLLMIPLAITSTDGMVRRLGAKRWKRLHRLAYPAVIGGSIHYIMQAKSDLRQPLVFAGVLGAALVYRIAARALAKPAKKKFWAGTLKIAKIKDETHDVRTFRFVHPEGGALPFDHISGQYLSLKLEIDGKRVNRSYTIASGPNPTYCEISVKKATDGYGSKHLHETWKEGDLVQISAPAGKFHFAGPESRRVVLIAGGIGITPMMSVIRSLTSKGWSGDMYLAYSVRTPKDIAFADELALLQKQHANLHVAITVGDDPDGTWTGPKGRITRELLDTLVPALRSGPVMLCGPDPMMTAMRELVVGMGVPDAEVHQEAFISPSPLPAAPAGTTMGEDPPLADGQVAALTFQTSSATTEVGNDVTILEAAEQVGVDIPFECRSGICGQCKIKLISGMVRMDSQDALSPGERSSGLVLACQARATRDCVIDA